MNNDNTIGFSADIDDLVEAYMTREKAKEILKMWDSKPKSDWVSAVETGEWQLDGRFTANELKAIAWCMDNSVSIGTLLFED